ncbi:MAG: hypothetical protein PVG49_16610, partial [Desulfobacteraceae bacterium]
NEGGKAEPPPDALQTRFKRSRIRLKKRLFLPSKTLRLHLKAFHPAAMRSDGTRRPIPTARGFQPVNRDLHE